MKKAESKDSTGAARKIYLVDDHAVLRNGLAELINRTEGLRVCGESAGSEEALQEILKVKPDLAIVDLTLEGSSGLDLIKSLRLRQPSLPVLVLSMHDELLYAERCLRAGAKGYVMKHEAIDVIRNAIRQILDGKIYVSGRMSDRLLQAIARGGSAGSGSPVDQLSDRELEVFDLIGRGHGPSEIARRMHLSVKTIETYQSKLKEKLSLRDAAELLQHALRWVERRTS